MIRLRRLRPSVMGAVLLGGLFLAGATSAQEHWARSLALIRPGGAASAAPDFVLPAPDGAPIRLQDYNGQVVFLNFWATWCPPCREEMPGMQRLYDRLRQRGFTMIALSLDAQGEAVVRPFALEHRLTFPIGLDPKRAVADRYRVGSLPSSVIIDRKGAIVAIAKGPRDWSSPEAVDFITSILARQ